MADQYGNADSAEIGDSRSGRLSFQRIPGYQPPSWPDPAFPPQVHLDLQVSDITEAEAKVLALGATRLPGTGPGRRLRSASGHAWKPPPTHRRASEGCD